MVTKEEALKLALDALEYMDGHYLSLPQQGMQALTAIKEALAQPAQEPEAYIRKDQLQKAVQSAMLCEVTSEPRQDRIGIYTTQPQRPWVGLTAQEAAECWTTNATQTWKNFETKLKEKNKP